MDGINAVFGHPEDKHFNGKHYNRKSSIPRNKKCWDWRNNLWSIRYMMAIFKLQLLSNVFQSGSNLLETIHAHLKRWLGWLKQDGGGLDTAVAFGFVGLFKNNITKAKKMMEMSAQKQQYGDRIIWSDEFINKYYKVLCKANELLEIDDKNPSLPKQLDNGHGIFHFNDAKKSFDEHLQCMNICYIFVAYAMNMH